MAVALLGERAAEQLGINFVDTHPSIFIDDIAYAVITPTGTACADFAAAAPGQAQARIGAVIGLLAGGIPALRASKIEPVTALTGASMPRGRRSKQDTVPCVVLGHTPVATSAPVERGERQRSYR